MQQLVPGPILLKNEVVILDAALEEGLGVAPDCVSGVGKRTSQKVKSLRKCLLNLFRGWLNGMDRWMEDGVGGRTDG